MIANFKLNDTLTRLIRFNLTTSRIVPMLLGEAAIGKSSWVHSVAQELDTQAFVINANTLADKADVTATRVETDKKGNAHQVFLPMKKIRDANDFALANPAKPVLVFIDEINRADSDITSALLTMVTDRSNGDLELADNIRFIVAGNDRGNVNELDTASLSRFTLYHVVPDAGVFTDILGDRLNSYVRNVMVANPELILCKSLPSSVTSGVDVDTDGDDADAFSIDFADPDAMKQFTAPRTLEGLSDTLNQITRDDYIEMLGTEIEGSNLLQQLINAHIGETAFAEKLLTHISESVTTPAATQAPSTPTPATPPTWSTLTTMTTVADINQHIDGLTPADRGDLFLYSCWTKRGSIDDSVLSAITDALLGYSDPAEVGIGRDRLSTLISLSTANEIDPSVVSKLDEDIHSNSALTTTLGPVMSMIAQD